MSLVPSTGQDVFSDVSTRLTTLASTLSDAGTAKLVAPTAVATQLDEIAALTSVGLGELEFSPNQRAVDMAPAVAEAMGGMSALADTIATDPKAMTATATVEAISGWAQLASGATIALHRL